MQGELTYRHNQPLRRDIEVGRVGDEYFLALEYVEGRDLRRTLGLLTQRKTRMPVDLALFDLICGLRARASAVRWLDAYREQGCPDSPRQFAGRVTPLLRQALAHLGA